MVRRTGQGSRTRTTAATTSAAGRTPYERSRPRRSSPNSADRRLVNAEHRSDRAMAEAADRTDLGDLFIREPSIAVIRSTGIPASAAALCGHVRLVLGVCPEEQVIRIEAGRV